MNNYNHLDLDKVKDLVCQYTSIKQANDYIQNEDIIFNPLVIKSKLKDSEEALTLLKKTSIYLLMALLILVIS